MSLRASVKEFVNINDVEEVRASDPYISNNQ